MGVMVDQHHRVPEEVMEHRVGTVSRSVGEGLEVLRDQLQKVVAGGRVRFASLRAGLEVLTELAACGPFPDVGRGSSNWGAELSRVRLGATTTVCCLRSGAPTLWAEVDPERGWCHGFCWPDEERSLVALVFRRDADQLVVASAGEAEPIVVDLADPLARSSPAAVDEPPAAPREQLPAPQPELRPPQVPRAQRWYYVRDLERVGPVSRSELQRLLRATVLHADTFVWHPGMADWVEATAVPGLVSTDRVATVSPAVLVVDGPHQSSRRVTLGPVTRIGRDEGNELRLDDPKVSALHAVIRKDRQSYVLVDRRSTNGTWHNGVRVKAPVVLANDDVVAMGHWTIRVLLPGVMPPSHCDSCGAEIRDRARFCGSCGDRVVSDDES